MRPELTLLALLLTACGGGSTPTVADVQPTPQPTPPVTPAPVTPAPSDVREASADPRVKAKSGRVWRNDLSQALALARNEVCLELGAYDCVDDVHNIAMGGVEPKRAGIFEPIPSPPASAPIAFDRVAISACATRLQRDQQGTPVVFTEVLATYDAPAREAVATRLVQRLLGRDVEPGEAQRLSALHDAIAAHATDPMSDWAVGACVVVATSTEALFY